MSADRDLEVLRKAYGDWARGDYSDGQMFHPDVEFVTGGLEPRVYHGVSGAQQAWRDFLSAWDDFRTEATEFLQAREDLYVVLVHLTGRGKGSGVPTEHPSANVISMRDGRIVRIELFWDRVEALARAGIPARAPTRR